MHTHLILQSTPTAKASFILSQLALSHLHVLPTARMVVTRGISPRYALALKTVCKVSDNSLPSAVRRHLARHSPHVDVDFVCSEHLTPSGNGYHTLHRSVNKRASALRLSVPHRKRKFRISAITAAIYKKNTGIKVDPSQITPSRGRSSLRPSPH